MAKSDLSYTSDGFYVQLLANTPSGEVAFNEVCEYFTGAKFPAHMLPSVKAQLKKAGHTIRKQAKSKKMTAAETDKLLKELEG